MTKNILAALAAVAASPALAHEGHHTHIHPHGVDAFIAAVLVGIVLVVWLATHKN